MGPPPADHSGAHVCLLETQYLLVCGVGGNGTKNQAASDNDGGKDNIKDLSNWWPFAKK